MEKLEQLAPAVNYTGSAAAVGSAVAFGYTEAEWLVITGLVGMFVAIVGLVFQAWVSWYRVQGYKKIREMAERREDETAEEHEHRLIRMLDS